MSNPKSFSMIALEFTQIIPKNENIPWDILVQFLCNSCTVLVHETCADLCTFGNGCYGHSNIARVMKFDMCHIQKVFYKIQKMKLIYLIPL